MPHINKCERDPGGGAGVFLAEISLKRKASSINPRPPQPTAVCPKGTLTGFTVGPLPAVTADALVGVDTIDAGASVFAGVALTVVNI